MVIGITGGNGFVGQCLLEELENVEVVNICRGTGYDILDIKKLKTLPKLDCIIHLAAQSYVPESYSKPQQFFETNVNGTNNMLELARIMDAKFIFLSSYVYGAPTILPTPETHRIQALNPYGASKVMGEDLCNYYSDFFDVSSIILRPFNIYGLGQSDRFLIPKIIKQAKEGNINLFDNKPKRDYVHVKDVAGAIIASISYSGQERIFNIGSGETYSVNQIVEMVLRITKKDINVTYSRSDRPSEIMETLADISKANEELDWAPRISLEEGLGNIFKSQG